MNWGTRGFEHGPVTSTRCQNCNVDPGRHVFSITDRSNTLRPLLEPRVVEPVAVTIRFNQIRADPFDGTVTPLVMSIQWFRTQASRERID